MPAHADNISIDLDTTTVTLQRSGNLYKHNSSVRVRNSNTYGFTLSMNADQSNLVNGKDSTYKIDSVSGTNQQLAANQWGYGMGKDATTFNPVSSATLADVTSDSKGSCNGVDDCTLYLTFGANLDPKHLPTGTYSTSITYTATSKPAPYVPPAPDPEPYVPPTPPAPEPPKWTTNGCYYYSDYNGRLLDRLHNCERPDYKDGRPVMWKNNAWYGIKYNGLGWNNWFDYRTSNATWAHIAILTESGERKYVSIYGSDSIGAQVELDSNDIVKILAFVPVYSRQDNYINFCGSYDPDKCKYSGVKSYFGWEASYRHGFWVGLHAMGCTNVPDESKCNADHYYKCRDQDMLQRSVYSSDAKKVADTLAEALGSPCY